MEVALPSQFDWAERVCTALRSRFGQDAKACARAAKSSVRSAENWLQMRNAPGGRYLTNLMSECDELTAEVLSLAQRADILEAHRKARAVGKIEEAMRLLKGEDA